VPPVGDPATRTHTIRNTTRAMTKSRPPAIRSFERATHGRSRRRRRVRPVGVVRGFRRQHDWAAAVQGSADVRDPLFVLPDAYMTVETAGRPRADLGQDPPGHRGPVPGTRAYSGHRSSVPLRAVRRLHRRAAGAHRRRASRRLWLQPRWRRGPPARSPVPRPHPQLGDRVRILEQRWHVSRG
jgi:hypothetical protein